MNIKNDELIELIFFNDVSKKLHVGKPKQEITFYFKFNTYDTYIINNTEYISSHSMTYNLITNTSLSTDSLEIDNEKNINLNYSFILKTKTSDYSQSVFGLNTLNKFPNNSNFLYQLQKNKIIDKRIFSILYGEKNIYKRETKDGQIIFGNLLHELSKYYLKEDLKWCSLYNDKSSEQKWEIQFDNVNFDDQQLKNKNVEFVLEFNLIIGTEEFRKIIIDKFFKYNIEKKLCKEEYFFNNRLNRPFIYFICDNLYNLNTNKVINFYSENLNETFNFKMDELFFRFKQKYYLGIVFEGKPTNNNVEKWKLGKIFFEKYPLVFDDENKKIGYYKIQQDYENPYILVFTFVFVFSIFFALIANGFKKQKIIMIKNKIKDDNLNEKKNDKSSPGNENNKNQKEKTE